MDKQFTWLLIAGFTLIAILIFSDKDIEAIELLALPISNLITAYFSYKRGFEKGDEIYHFEATRKDDTISNLNKENAELRQQLGDNSNNGDFFNY